MNLFEDIPTCLDEEEFKDLLNKPGVRIERIVSRGQVSDPCFWYEQQENEWVVLLEGEAILEYADGAKDELSKGDYIFIPAMKKHRVAYTSTEPACIWLAVFFGGNDV